MVKVEKVPVQAPEFRSPGPNALLKGIYPSNQKFFCSSEQTGNGSEQSIAHGLGSTPAKVFVACTDNSSSSSKVCTVSEGTHDGTSVKVTVTNAAKYKVLAWL